jgi:hypothetical protein
VGFVVDKVALGQVLSEYFGFPWPMFIPPISPQSPSPIIRGWYNKPVVAGLPRDSVSPTKNKKKTILAQLYPVFPQSFQENYVTIPQNRLQLLPSSFF